MTTPLICQHCDQFVNVLYRLPDNGIMQWLCWACYPPHLRHTNPATITLDTE